MVSTATTRTKRSKLLSQALQGLRQEVPTGLGLATLSGGLWALACINFDAWPLAWIAMVPALFAIARASSTRRAVFFAWWTGLVGNACGFYWMVEVIERFAGLSRTVAVLLFLLLCGYHALRLALFGWVVRVVVRRFELPLALVAPLAMVTAEMCVPLIFRYYIAMSVSRQLSVIQIADITGVVGVTALLLMTNGVVYDVLSRPRQRLKVVAVCAAIIIAVLGYGHLRLKQFAARRAEAPKMKVGVVQPNTITFTDASSGGQLVAQRKIAELQARASELEAAGADLIVWPESSYPTWVSREAQGDRPQSDPTRIKRGFSAPLVFNATTYHPPLDSGRPYNSALLLDRDGKFSGRYDKNHLFMFGEYVPGSETFPWLTQLSPLGLKQYAAGEEVRVFEFKDREGRAWRLGPMICLEDILPDFGRRLGAMRPHLLVNLTNDSWFGDTSEPWQHLALSVFRSVELRTEMVRAVNTGVSAYVDATGRVYAETYVVDPRYEARGADKLLAEVALMEGGRTFYVMTGDWFGYLCIGLTLYLSLWLPLMRRRQAAGASPAD